MKLSKKAEYGLRAMIDLGIAQSLEYEVVPLSELAEAENLPIKFLEQIMIELRREGLVATQRGKAGGYYVAKELSSIKIGQIVRLLDGPLAPICCASQTAYERCSCPDEEHCGLRMLMIDVRNAMSNILDRYSLHDVVEVTLRKIRRSGADNYFMRMKNKAKESATRNNAADPKDGFLAELMNDLGDKSN
ncbi:Rrf2 family transcriptional regulator [Pelagicoccus sp. SDUM812003]|uniref:RrF2 family transcriptional regulator n=1 Tax=Pelagicoccus sp. SDUM812003 TaxID=3041267 RepID=UPI00280E7A9F|nr:Rrf2 family transcriptional regulator [Pelagicoccus sp. SDUM812003]MDQ8205578.1 Rrf2 family transcriptional regulator [Pelagicoccus sp. SDUM812003]